MARSTILLLALLLMALFQSCYLYDDDDATPTPLVGDDDLVFDDDSASFTPTPTVAPTPTATPVGSPTPTVETDNDNDGWSIAKGDCDDGNPTVFPTNPDFCGDGLDNNCDGFIDNRDDDADGALHIGCGSGGDCDDTNPLVFPGAPELCADGLDNNCNGRTDCSEQSCDWNDLCRELFCQDGADNDGDGLPDCQDPDCQQMTAACPQTYGGDCCNPHNYIGCNDNHANECVCGADISCCATGWDALCVARWTGSCGGACVAENCSNGIDDDGDGLIDCLDPVCLGSNSCHESNCGNGLDDDGDGVVDCQDWDCVSDTACYESQCNDGVDNDGDGDTDCLDINCVAAPSCVIGYSGACCSVHVGAGCAGATSVMQCVCAAIPSCCFRGWNAPWDSLCIAQYTSCGGACP